MTVRWAIHVGIIGQACEPMQLSSVAFGLVRPCAMEAQAFPFIPTLSGHLGALLEAVSKNASPYLLIPTYEGDNISYVHAVKTCISIGGSGRLRGVTATEPLPTHTTATCRYTCPAPPTGLRVISRLSGLSLSFNPFVISNMHAFDLMETGVARGRARYELISKPRDSDDTFGLEWSEVAVDRVVSKDLNRRPEAVSSEQASCPINKHLCRACCRILQGTGIEAINLLRTDKDGVLF